MHYSPLLFNVLVVKVKPYLLLRVKAIHDLRSAEIFVSKQEPLGCRTRRCDFLSLEYKILCWGSFLLLRYLILGCKAWRCCFLKVLAVPNMLRAVN